MCARLSDNTTVTRNKNCAALPRTVENFDKAAFTLPISLFPLLAPPAIAQSDDAFLDTLQERTFQFFWREANAANGLIRDRSQPGSACSIASTGFGLTAITIGIDRGWIARAEGRDRVLRALATFWTMPQSRDATGAIGYKGFFYHFLDMNSATRSAGSELSSIDTALLLAGVLDARGYFTGADTVETRIRDLADSIYRRVDWEWMRNFNPLLTMGWSPEGGFITALWSGYCEAMILYVLAIGSPTHPISGFYWKNWTGGYRWDSWYGQSYVIFPPLFGHQYSHCWIDFRRIWDEYMKARGITYFENSRRATLAQRAYCIANPGGFAGYGANVWGLTACDGPDGYKARGAPPAQDDDGTIAPAAAGGSIPFAPEVCIPALRHMRDTYGPQLWMQYGFRDAFNIGRNWWDTDVIGIDEGPILIMAENYRTQAVWNRFMRNPDVARGLALAGFRDTASTNAGDVPPAPASVAIVAVHPRPASAAATISFEIGLAGVIALDVVDELGRTVARVAEGRYDQGRHTVVLDASRLRGGAYTIVLRSGPRAAIAPCIIVH